MKLIHLIIIAVFVLFCLSLTLPAAAQKMQKAGNTDCGTLYVDTDTVKTVKKDGQYYLAVAAEERYTDAEFLASLRQGEDMQQATAAVYLYLFDNRGANYCIAAAYIVDTEGKVCADVGSNMTLLPVGKDKTMSNAYSIALKALENRNRFQNKKSFVR